MSRSGTEPGLDPHALVDVFGIDDKLEAGTGRAIYDVVVAKLRTPAFRPRAL